MGVNSINSVNQEQLTTHIKQQLASRFPGKSFTDFDKITSHPSADGKSLHFHLYEGSGKKTESFNATATIHDSGRVLVAFSHEVARKYTPAGNNLFYPSFDIFKTAIEDNHMHAHASKAYPQTMGAIESFIEKNPKSPLCKPLQDLANAMELTCQTDGGRNFKEVTPIQYLDATRNYGEHIGGAMALLSKIGVNVNQNPATKGTAAELPYPQEFSKYAESSKAAHAEAVSRQKSNEATMRTGGHAPELTADDLTKPTQSKGGLAASMTGSHSTIIGAGPTP